MERSPRPGPFVAIGELVGADYAAYPNVKAWLGHMKTLKGNPMVAV